MFDKDTGLQNNLNRWYDAAVGRWISEDPIGFRADDANLYRYVGNGSMNAVDPNGLIPGTGCGEGDLYGNPGGGSLLEDILDWLCPPVPPLDSQGFPIDTNEESLKVSVSCREAGKDLAKVAGAHLQVNIEGATSIKEIIGWVKDDFSKSGEDCIGVLQLDGHGSPDGIIYGTGDAKDDGCIVIGSGSTGAVRIDDAGQFGADLKAGLKFCSSCTIVLNACNVGNKTNTTDNPSWVQKLADSSGCTIIAAGGFSSSGCWAEGSINVTKRCCSRLNPDAPPYTLPIRGDWSRPADDQCYKFSPTVKGGKQ